MWLLLYTLSPQLIQKHLRRLETMANQRILSILGKTILQPKHPVQTQSFSQPMAPGEMT
jgi:hypothetical protein